MRYLGTIRKLLAQSYPRLLKIHDVEFKNCFGAVAGYVDNKLFITCGKFGVALKLSPKSIAKLIEEKGVKKLRYFPRGHIKKDYLVIPNRLIKDPVRFKKLVNESVRFVSMSTGARWGKLI